MIYLLQRLIAGIIALLIALTVHECCHAWVAYQLGDYTTKHRVTLNPIAHLDPLGTLIMGMSLLNAYTYGFNVPLIGWGKPVRVNPYLLRKGGRTGMGMISLAGPMANLITALVFALPLRLGLYAGYLTYLLSVIAMTNVSIAVFNLIPVPPLDGFGVLMWVVSSIRAPWAFRLSATLARLEARGPMALMVLILLDWILPISIIGIIMGPLFRLFSGLILGPGRFG